MRTLALSLALAGVIAYAILFARPLESDAALAPHDPPLPREDGRPRDRAQTAYWSLERRYWRLERSAGRLGAEVRRLRRAHRVRYLQSRPQVSYAIKLAASSFGVSEAEMRAVADCETGGSFSPTSYNASSGASGLFQFLSGTWDSQGLDGFSVWDPIANALATARIVAREGWAQWACRP